MLPFEPLQKNLKRLKQGGINAIMQELITKNLQIIKGLQTFGQMYKGERSDGSEIEPPYKGLTKMIKGSKGQPYDRVTLRDTGDFYNKVYVKMDNQGFELDSADPKRDKLVKKYKPEIFGLTDLNKRALAQQLKPQLLNEIKRLI